MSIHIRVSESPVDLSKLFGANTCGGYFNVVMKTADGDHVRYFRAGNSSRAVKYVLKAFADTGARSHDLLSSKWTRDGWSSLIEIVSGPGWELFVHYIGDFRHKRANAKQLKKMGWTVVENGPKMIVSAAEPKSVEDLW